MLWLVVAAALAAKPQVVEITVVDAGGNPVTNAVVHFAAEGAQTHPVHGEKGTWTNDGLDLPSGERAPFTKGQAITFEVSAEGYVTEETTATLGKKGTALTVELEAAPHPEDWGETTPDYSPPEGSEPAEEPEPAETP